MAQNTNDIQQRLVNILGRRFDKGEFPISARFVEDLGADSLDVVEVIMAIEEEFGVEIPDSEAESIKTIEQMIEYIKTATQKNA